MLCSVYMFEAGDMLFNVEFFFVGYFYFTYFTKNNYPVGGTNIVLKFLHECT